MAAGTVVAVAFVRGSGDGAASGGERIVQRRRPPLPDATLWRRLAMVVQGRRPDRAPRSRSSASTVGVGWCGVRSSCRWVSEVKTLLCSDASNGDALSWLSV
uniref:Uncharacterized protein n=1 Tax=Oryza nivara TaxID=4536 RepID=A0A0E0GGB8_ORYNI